MASGEATACSSATTVTPASRTLSLAPASPARGALLRVHREPDRRATAGTRPEQVGGRERNPAPRRPRRGILDPTVLAVIGSGRLPGRSAAPRSGPDLPHVPPCACSTAWRRAVSYGGEAGGAGTAALGGDRAGHVVLDVLEPVAGLFADQASAWRRCRRGTRAPGRGRPGQASHEVALGVATYDDAPAGSAVLGIADDACTMGKALTTPGPSCCIPGQGRGRPPPGWPCASAHRPGASATSRSLLHSGCHRARRKMSNVIPSGPRSATRGSRC